MESTVSYINDRGEYKIAILPEEIADTQIEYDESIEAYTYTHPVHKTVHLLHSTADRPCLLEAHNRQHWMWRGKLHRTSGPAFTCYGNREWYVFGVMVEPSTFEKYKEYFLRVEAFAYANGIDLHGVHNHVDVNKYFLSFNDEEHLINCAEANILPLCDRTTGDLYGYNLEELDKEVRVEERGSWVLMAAVLGAAAAFAATKIKKHMESSSKVEVKEQQVSQAR
jgi:hypothetical protein